MKRVLLYVIQIITIIVVLLFLSCKRQNSRGQEIQYKDGDSTIVIRLERIIDTLYVLKANIYWQGKKIHSSTYRLPYAVYRFQLGDIDNNGQMDIAVGVVKSTYYDPIPRKRPFFFKLYKGNIRPLWLGSRLSQPLDDFMIKKEGEKNILRSIEFEKDGQFLVVQYVWTGFGFRFVKYLARNINHNEAYKLLTK